jgi:hypothetical protein
MSVEKSSISEKSDQRPTDKKTDELDEKQLDKAVGGNQGASAGGVARPPPAPVG